jgi:hypothetical protein
MAENIQICIQTLIKSKLEKLLLSNSIIKMSPSFTTALNYYLTNVLLFTNLDFSIKQLTTELFFFVGIICLNTVFKNTKRGKFLRINGFGYVLTNLLVILMLYVLKAYPDIPAITLILVYTGFHSLFFEIFSLPIVSIFLEICPENLEGFFMSLIFFLNNFSRNVGTFLGTLCIYVLKMESTDLKHLTSLIVIHVSFGFVGLCLLMFSFIPDRKKAVDNEDIEEFDNNYLAYINTKDSIILDEAQTYYPQKNPSELKSKETETINGNEKHMMFSNEKLHIARSDMESDSIN